MNDKQRNLKAIGVMLHDAKCRGDKRAEAMLQYLRNKVVADEISVKVSHELTKVIDLVS